MQLVNTSTFSFNSFFFSFFPRVFSEGFVGYGKRSGRERCAFFSISFFYYNIFYRFLIPYLQWDASLHQLPLNTWTGLIYTYIHMCIYTHKYTYTHTLIQVYKCTMCSSFQTGLYAHIRVCTLRDAEMRRHMTSFTSPMDQWMAKCSNFSIPTSWSSHKFTPNLVLVVWPHRISEWFWRLRTWPRL